MYLILLTPNVLSFKQISKRFFENQFYVSLPQCRKRERYLIYLKARFTVTDLDANVFQINYKIASSEVLATRACETSRRSSNKRRPKISKTPLVSRNDPKSLFLLMIIKLYSFWKTENSGSFNSLKITKS